MTVKTYEYDVTGNFAFPFDMLRYDTAWPAKESEIHLLGNSYVPLRTIRIRSNKKPTDARWKSFGWKVENVREIR